MNIVILQGNLGADPELRYTQSGAAVLNMRLATTTKFKRGDEWDERTDWHSCEIWNKRAEALAKILEKGTRILIRGSIKYGSYEDKEGVKRYTTTIAIDDLELLGGKRKEDDDRGSRSNSRSSSNNTRPSENRSSGKSQQQQSRPSDTPNFDDGGGGVGGDGGDDDIPFVPPTATASAPWAWETAGGTPQIERKRFVSVSYRSSTMSARHRIPSPN